jgi:hypothetical protein
VSIPSRRSANPTADDRLGQDCRNVTDRAGRVSASLQGHATSAEPVVRHLPPSPRAMRRLGRAADRVSRPANVPTLRLFSPCDSRPIGRDAELVSAQIAHHGRNPSRPTTPPHSSRSTEPAPGRAEPFLGADRPFDSAAPRSGQGRSTPGVTCNLFDMREPSHFVIQNGTVHWERWHRWRSGVKTAKRVPARSEAVAHRPQVDHSTPCLVLVPRTVPLWVGAAAQRTCLGTSHLLGHPML